MNDLFFHHVHFIFRHLLPVNLRCINRQKCNLIFHLSHILFHQINSLFNRIVIFQWNSVRLCSLLSLNWGLSSLFFRKGLFKGVKFHQRKIWYCELNVLVLFCGIWVVYKTEKFSLLFRWDNRWLSLAFTLMLFTFFSNITKLNFC